MRATTASIFSFTTECNSGPHTNAVHRDPCPHTAPHLPQHGHSQKRWQPSQQLPYSPVPTPRVKGNIQKQFTHPTYASTRQARRKWFQHSMASPAGSDPDQSGPAPNLNIPLHALPGGPNPQTRHARQAAARFPKCTSKTTQIANTTEPFIRTPRAHLKHACTPHHLRCPARPRHPCCLNPCASSVDSAEACCNTPSMPENVQRNAIHPDTIRVTNQRPNRRLAYHHMASGMTCRAARAPMPRQHAVSCRHPPAFPWPATPAVVCVTLTLQQYLLHGGAQIAKGKQSPC